jgi:hypothetical protein
LLAGVSGGVEDPWLGVSLSAKASWMKENFADQLRSELKPIFDTAKI